MTRKTFTPREYQRAMINRILDAPRVALWAWMGMGKTAATLTALRTLALLDERPALVLAPLLVANTTWPDETLKWSHLDGFTVTPVTGSAREREAALKQDSPVYSINYENIPWLVDKYKGKWPFKTVVADESTRLKSFRLRQGGARAHALARVAHSCVERFVELTGTPGPNGLQDLWGQFWFLDRGQRLGASFSAFTMRWFNSVRVGADPYAIQLRPRAHAQEQIQEAIADLCLSLDARDYFDLQAPIVNVKRFELPAKARKIYEDLELGMFAELANGVSIEAFNAGSKAIKCLQLTGGAVYTDETGFTEIHDTKIQALESIVENAAGNPVLVAYHFRHEIERLLRAFPKGRQLDKNPQTIRDWNAGKIPVLFAHPASAGHGLNLQDGGNILVFFSRWWDLEQHQQIIERIGPTRQKQAGHDRPVFVHHLIAADTVDEVVLERLESKRKVQDVLLDYMKRKGAK